MQINRCEKERQVPGVAIPYFILDLCLLSPDAYYPTKTEAQERITLRLPKRGAKVRYTKLRPNPPALFLLCYAALKAVKQHALKVNISVREAYIAAHCFTVEVEKTGKRHRAYNKQLLLRIAYTKLFYVKHPSLPCRFKSFVTEVRGKKGKSYTFIFNPHFLRAFKHALDTGLYLFVTPRDLTSAGVPTRPGGKGPKRYLTLTAWLLQHAYPPSAAEHLGEYLGITNRKERYAWKRLWHLLEKDPRVSKGRTPVSEKDETVSEKDTPRVSKGRLKQKNKRKSDT